MASAKGKITLATTHDGFEFAMLKETGGSEIKAGRLVKLSGNGIAEAEDGEAAIGVSYEDIPASGQGAVALFRDGARIYIDAASGFSASHMDAVYAASGTTVDGGTSGDPLLGHVLTLSPTQGGRLEVLVASTLFHSETK